jgi:hypothetical protein
VREEIDNVLKSKHYLKINFRERELERGKHEKIERRAVQNVNEP